MILDILVGIMVIVVIGLAIAYYFKEEVLRKMFRTKKPVEEAALVENPAKMEKTPIEQKAEQINEMKAPEPEPARPQPVEENPVDVLVQIVIDQKTGIPHVLAKPDLDVLAVYVVGMPFMKAIEEKLVEKNFNNLQLK